MEKIQKIIDAQHKDLMNKSLTLEQHNYAKMVYMRAVQAKGYFKNGWVNLDQALNHIRGV